MPSYKNITNSVKTFYGVEIGPNEIKFVPGFVNCDGVIRCEVPEQPAKPEVPAATKRGRRGGAQKQTGKHRGGASTRSRNRANRSSSN